MNDIEGIMWPIAVIVIVVGFFVMVMNLNKVSAEVYATLAEQCSKSGGSFIPTKSFEAVCLVREDKR